MGQILDKSNRLVTGLGGNRKTKPVSDVHTLGASSGLEFLGSLQCEETGVWVSTWRRD